MSANLRVGPSRYQIDFPGVGPSLTAKPVQVLLRPAEIRLQLKGDCFLHLGLPPLAHFAEGLGIFVMGFG